MYRFYDITFFRFQSIIRSLYYLWSNHGIMIGRLCIESQSKFKPNYRPGPIMLFKLLIMLLSNASKFSLLCPNYAPLCPIMLHI